MIASLVKLVERQLRVVITTEQDKTKLIQVLRLFCSTSC